MIRDWSCSWPKRAISAGSRGGTTEVAGSICCHGKIQKPDFSAKDGACSTTVIVGRGCVKVSSARAVGF